MPSSSIEFGALLIGLFGGVALFLFGMRQMTESLKAVAGSSMKNLLARLTANRFTAAIAGAVITAVVQSSSVTTVLIVGFISAGLLTLSQSIGVIIGANVGTTITAQVIAFKVYQYGLLMIALGFLAEVIAKNDRMRQWGMATMGLGLIFFGMELMSNATLPLRQWSPFIDLMQSMQNPIYSILIGLVFTAIVQSSSATTGIVIVLASQGVISLEAGIGLILGANAGTCITAFVASFGRPREAVQAAWIHVIFNLGGVLLWMFFVPQFAEFVRTLSPSASNLDGAAKLAADTPRQIANAHTAFNVGNALLFIWFTGPLAKLVDWIVPQRPEPEGVRPVHLDKMYLEHPAMALDQVRRELVRQAELVREMVTQSFGVVTVGTQMDIARLRQAEEDVDTLHEAIITYLAQLSQKNLNPKQLEQLYKYIGITNYLENVGDVVENDVLPGAVKRLRIGMSISPSTMDALSTVHQRVCHAFEHALEALRDGSQTAARDAAASKIEVNGLAEKATSHLTTRLVAYEPNRLVAFKLETDFIENMKRINTLTRRIARVFLVDNQTVTAPVDEQAISAP
jgi:phosphate:Na+ symporter